MPRADRQFRANQIDYHKLPCLPQLVPAVQPLQIGRQEGADVAHVIAKDLLPETGCSIGQLGERNALTGCFRSTLQRSAEIEAIGSRSKEARPMRCVLNRIRKGDDLTVVFLTKRGGKQRSQHDAGQANVSAKPQSMLGAQVTLQSRVRLGTQLVRRSGHAEHRGEYIFEELADSLSLFPDDGIIIEVFAEDALCIGAEIITALGGAERRRCAHTCKVLLRDAKPRPQSP